MKIDPSALHRIIIERLPFIFAVLIAPLVFCFSVVAPPMQAPDEWAHYAHSVQVAGGEMIGTKAPGSAGAHIPESTVAFINFFQDRRDNIPALVRDPKVKLRALDWHSPKTFYQYRLVVYPPFSYMPAALGLVAGRIVGASLLMSFYLGRFCAALAFVMIALFAIRRATAGKLLLFALLAMPMTIYLGSSFSHDGLLISCSAVVVAGLGDWLNNPAGRGGSVRGRWLLAFALAALALIVAERPPYAPLVLAGAAVALTAVQDRKTALKMAAVAAVIPCATAALWMVVTHGFVTIGDGVDAGENLKFLLRHFDQLPAEVWATVWATFHNVNPVVTKGFIGVIGSFSNPGSWLPMYCYEVFSFVLAASLLHDSLFSKNALPFPRRGMVVAGILGAIGSLYLWALLCLTPPGSATIHGMQGRYFIIPALFLALVIGRTAPAAISRLKQWAALGLLVSVLGGIWVADVGAVLTNVESYLFP